jgi:hypothetical protein
MQDERAAGEEGGEAGAHKEEGKEDAPHRVLKSGVDRAQPFNFTYTLSFCRVNISGILS